MTMAAIPQNPRLQVQLDRHKKALVILFLIVSTLAVFWQVRNHEFIDFDDPEYITRNTHVTAGLSVEGLIWAFTTFHASNWHPLTWLSHMLDCELFGLNPGGHHLTSVAIHIASTIILFLLLHNMTGAMWRSAFVAALFALHPLRVESVAWISERKDVLSTLFWMATLWAYAVYVQKPEIKRYLLVFFLFGLGLTAKPMLVTLPFVLLLLDYWPLGRMKFGNADGGHRSANLRLLTEKIPFLVLSGVSCFVTFIAQNHGGAVQSLESLPLMARICNALLAYVAYIGKMIWPHNLAVYYPHPISVDFFAVAAAALLLMGISGLMLHLSRRHASLVVGWFWYLGTLVPVIGLVQVGMHAMADRYTYVPLVGLAIIAAWGVPTLIANWQYRSHVLAVSALILIPVLMVATFTQTRRWRDSITLFEYTLEVTTDNRLVHYNLGLALAKKGGTKEAIAHYREALRINPNDVDANNNLGNILAKSGKYDEAIGHYFQALKADPEDAKGYNNLGNVLSSLGRNREAIDRYREALQIKPDFAQAHYNLGRSLAELGEVEGAIESYKAALRIDPNSAEAHYSFGAVLTSQNKIDEATGHLSEAIRIKPEYAEARNNLGVVFSQTGKDRKAIEQFIEAIRIKPAYRVARVNLGLALSRQGETERAVPHFKEAVRIDPDDAQARFFLASASLDIGDRESAMKQYEILKKIHPPLANRLYRNISKTKATQRKISRH
jgi:tetratricopeptide (TPR) repeat protein